MAAFAIPTMTLEPRKKKPLVITDKDGNVIDLFGIAGPASSQLNQEEWECKANEFPPRVVTFDVGGQAFKVSRAVLEQHPTSMLAQLVAEACHEDADSPIFIDGDGERFRYCLDYLRHGRAYLPWTVSKDSLLQDLEYYGIPNINIDAIDESSASLTAAAQMFKIETEYQKELREYDAQIEEIERHKRYVMVAHACLQKFGQTGSLKELAFNPDVPPNHATAGAANKLDVLYEDVCAVFQFFDEELFNKCLAKYGLYHIRNELFRLPGSSNFGYQVSLGKIADEQTPT